MVPPDVHVVPVAPKKICTIFWWKYKKSVETPPVSDECLNNALHAETVSLLFFVSMPCCPRIFLCGRYDFVCRLHGLFAKGFRP